MNLHHLHGDIVYLSVTIKSSHLITFSLSACFHHFPTIICYFCFCFLYPSVSIPSLSVSLYKSLDQNFLFCNKSVVLFLYYYDYSRKTPVKFSWFDHHQDYVHFQPCIKFTKCCFLTLPNHLIFTNTICEYKTHS